MPEPDPPAILPYQVLADPTGRRRRRMAVAGRVATTALGLWLVVLILGGLGLQPLGGLPLAGRLGAREAAPPALPKRVQAAVARGATVTPTTQAAQTPATTAPLPSPHPAITAPSRAKTRSPARTTPSTGTKHTKTTPGQRTSPAPTTSPTTSSPSTAAPGQTKTGTSPSSTAPGQTKTETSPSSTAPGQTKTGTGPPTTTPGTTPGAKGKSYGAKGTATAP